MEGGLTMVFNILFFTISISKRKYSAEAVQMAYENNKYEENFQVIKNLYLQNINR